jgi:hypothetical protein
MPILHGSAVVVALVLAAGVAVAHITPPVVLVSEREAVAGLLAGGRRFFVREVRLAPEERQAIQKQWRWTPEEDFYRFYLGRDAEGRLVAASVFVSEFTVHGPVRVAVGLSPDGTVKGVTVVEVTEETYGWVKPLIDRDFARDYVGQGSGGRFGLGERLMKAGLDPMPQFYAQVLAGLVQRATILYDVGILRRGGDRGR